jgi:hypothetical protein
VEATLSSRGFQWFTRKPLGSLVDPQSQGRRPEATESDQCATTQSGDFGAEDTRRDRMACVEATQGAVVEHPSDGSMMKIAKVPLGGM